MDCPDDDDIVAYAAGHIGADARERMRAHFDACDVCAALVAEAGRGIVTRIEPAAHDLDASFEIVRGTALGRYLVLEPIGSGGLGHVLAAYDPQLDRRVALKLLDPVAHGGHTPDELRARLLREAQALARVKHANVVAVHDVGVVEHPKGSGEAVFLAMELVEGGTLRDWLHAQERSWREVRDVFVAVARGLCAVHDAGLVHRDVKPGNILVGHDGRVHVADFGLARALDVSSERRPESDASRGIEVSVSSTIVGTPAYMAPEQHRGEPVDARADQFALSVALFEALFHARPFHGVTPSEIHAAAMAGAVTKTASRGVPTWLRRVALRGLAADREARFPSLHAFIAALGQDRRRRRFGAVALAVGLAAATGVATLLLRPTPPSALADEQIETLVDEARGAAARAHFAYPPIDAPDEPTAYTKVLELEAIEGPTSALADARASLLRAEFAATLVALGDRYWEHAGGKPFAAEYYAQALVFDDDEPRSLARVGVSIAAMTALRERAAALSFGEPELVAAAPAHALAADEEPERIRRIEALYGRSSEPPAVLTASLEQIVGDAGRAAVARGRARQSSPTVAVAMPAEMSPPRETEPESVPIPTDPRRVATSIDAPGRAVATPPAAIPDASTAAEHGKAGRAALARGDLDAATTSFHRALEADRRHVPALAGLGEVAFQKRDYGDAAKFLERAIALSPKSPALRLELGDAYFKVLRYTDARAQYEEARELGHREAPSRIAKLDARLGAPR